MTDDDDAVGRTVAAERADALISSLRSGGGPEGRLLAFAERYAASRVLLDDAVILEVQARSAAASDDDDLIERVVALVGRIVEDHAAHGDQLAERERTMARLREELQRKVPPRVEVFAGRGLTRRQGKNFLLGPVNLTLRLGEITGVVGQNSHGKTTLLRLIAGELQPTAGDVVYPVLGETGRHLHWGSIKQAIAYVPQELPPWYGPLRDTLHYEAAIHGLLGVENERIVSSLVERLGLGEFVDRTWTQLSGGYKVRFALARALCWRPRLLVMDEPLANLDVRAKNIFLDDVRAVARSFSHPLAVILSSHDLHNLESICDQMVFLKSGQASFIGRVGAIGAGLHGEYEIATSLAVAELRTRLADTFVSDVREEGVNVLLHAAPERGPADVLRLLIEHDVPVHYFRDNSRSVRRLFE